MQVFLTTFVSEEAQTRHRCRHFEQHSADRPQFRDAVPSKGVCPWLPEVFKVPLLVLAALEPYYFETNPENDSSEDNEVDNPLEKYVLLTFVKDVKSVAGFSTSRQFRVGRNYVT